MTPSETILGLPSEIIASIATYLEDAELFAFRLASRHFERASFTHFGKHLFRKRGYMLTTPSLQVLQQVANHEELRKHVQHVWFNPDCYTFVHPICAPQGMNICNLGIEREGDIPFWTSSYESRYMFRVIAHKKQFEAYRDCMLDHLQLMSDSAAKLQALLTQIFATLPNLKIIGMRRSVEHAPRGWSQLRDAIGEDPRVLGEITGGPQDGLSAQTRLFTALMHAVDHSEVKLQRLYTDTIQLDLVGIPQAVFHKACHLIKYLEVNTTSTWSTYDDPNDSIGRDRTSKDGSGLAKLLQATSNLKELGLQVFSHGAADVTTVDEPLTLEYWRSSYSYVCMEKVLHSGGFHFQHLERVKLEALNVTPDMLLDFLAPSKTTLRSLKLRDVRLIPDLGSNDTRPWSPIFTFLSTACPKLFYIFFYRLRHAEGTVMFTREAFSEELACLEADFDVDLGTYRAVLLHVEGVDKVKEWLGRAIESHRYTSPIIDYGFDDDWHTDTSDEEW